MARVSGKLFILSAPSGTGKTSLTKSLLRKILIYGYQFHILQD